MDRNKCLSILSVLIVSGELCQGALENQNKKKDEKLQVKIDGLIYAKENLEEKQEYRNREYCKDISCPSLDEKLHSCETCGAYQFHDWLQKNGYKIVKE